LTILLANNPKNL